MLGRHGDGVVLLAFSVGILRISLGVYIATIPGVDPVGAPIGTRPRRTSRVNGGGAQARYLLGSIYPGRSRMLDAGA